MAPFKIPKPYATTSKSIRFPNDVIEQVEKAIVGQDCNFTVFVVAAVRFALENMDIPESKSSDHNAP